MMRANRINLLEALTKVRPALSDKAVIEQTDHFIFDGDFVRTYNDEISISYPFKSGLCSAIKADEFFQLVSKIESEEIVLEMSEGKLSIVAGKAKGQMVMVDEIKCPAITIKSKRWFSLPKNFSEAIRFCSFSADKNMLTKELTCLWVKDQYVVSSDNFRATKYEMGSKIVTEFLLPAAIAQKLFGYSPTHYITEAEGAWVHFKNAEGVIFSSRIVEGQYPEEIWGLFALKGDNIPIPEGLRNAVDRARVFSQETVGSNDLISLKVEKSGKLTCRGEGVLGWIEEEFSCAYKKKDFEVKVSPEALIEILSHVKEMKVSEDKLYFSGENFEHIISLI